MNLALDGGDRKDRQGLSDQAFRSGPGVRYFFRPLAGVPLPVDKGVQALSGAVDQRRAVFQGPARVHGLGGLVRGPGGALHLLKGGRDPLQLCGHTVADRHRCRNTRHGSSPSFLPPPRRGPFLFLLLLLDLKVDGSINEGPFPKGKGHQRAREDFQPVKGVVCIDGFAVRVLLTLSTGD